MNCPGLIDHHVHGVVTKDLDRAEFESLLTEAPAAPAAGMTMFDSQLGFAVRRWCAPVLDLEPSAPAEDYLQRRSELGVIEVNKRLLTAAGVGMWLVDTGFQGDQLTTPEQLADVSGTPSRHIVRLEAVAEQVARAGTSASGFASAFAAALARVTESNRRRGLQVSCRVPVRLRLQPGAAGGRRSRRRGRAGSCGRWTTTRRPGSRTRCCCGT